MAATTVQKAFGAFYTDERVAHFLVRWAARRPGDRILDPCFGGAAFLSEAATALAELGATDGSAIVGVELDSLVYDRTRRLLDSLRLPLAPALIRGDFFDIAPAMEGTFTAVVGNPPFVRYQSFGGESRRKALDLADRHGVRLSRLSSSWAPFIVASAMCLSDGGRLAMVVPEEIGHAAYARPVLSFLVRSFRRVYVLTFRERLFPALSQGTMLLLAEDRRLVARPRRPGGHLRWLDLPNADSLVPLSGRGTARALRGSTSVDAAGLVSGEARFAAQYLPAKARDLYLAIAHGQGFTRLGHVASVGIGYVTGANAFFHVNRRVMDDFALPEGFTLPAVTRSSCLRGLIFRQDDWLGAWDSGDTARLLCLRDAAADVPVSVIKYLEFGETQGVPRSFKCRVRSPWYVVPNVTVPDAILTYMSGGAPRLVVNAAHVVVPNTLHVVSLYPRVASAASLAASFQTSLAQLSSEVEGHGMGGGLLKMEPSEAERVLVYPGDNDGIAAEVDCLLRKGLPDEARRLADRSFLAERLGLSAQDCTLLSEGLKILRHRRQKRGVLLSLVAAVEKVGPIPDATARQDVKKRYSEVLSANLAAEVADGLAGLGFRDVRPGPGGHGEREFQGGLGPKRVDVSYSDHRHGLILAVSIKTICFAPFSKNLKNRFADLCTEAVSLHLRFPYAVICGLFAFPMAADRDHEDGRALSTFRRSLRLFGTIRPACPAGPVGECRGRGGGPGRSPVLAETQVHPQREIPPCNSWRRVLLGNPGIPNQLRRRLRAGAAKS